MADIVLHPITEARLKSLVSHPTHAVLLSGVAGSGKATLARQLSADLLEIELDKLAEHPYAKHIGDNAEKSISIDAVRELTGFLTRKVPGSGKRVVIIENAERLTTEAQNALLKTLEEPPSQTTLLLTAAHEQALLPTIRSRVTRLDVVRPTAEQMSAFFGSQGIDPQQIAQVQLMSGGLPGLMHALLNGETDHPLLQAAAVARQIIQSSRFERLAMVDMLAKDKEQTLHVLAMLQQMAHIALQQNRTVKGWQQVLARSYDAAALFNTSAQPKLVLSDLMLNL